MIADGSGVVNRPRTRQDDRPTDRERGPVRPIPPVTLPELFEAQAARTPSAPALIFEGDEIGYGELNARANRLAHELIGRGIGPEDVVAVLLPRSDRLIVALLAILKAGAAYLPLDPTYPAERIAAMLADARPKAVLTGRTPSAGLSATDRTPRIPIEECGAQGEDRDPVDADRTRPLSPAHPAYVIYTSGSTGSPKGVLMPGDTLVNLFSWHAGHLTVGPGTRTAQFSALGFDVSLHEILSTLVHGRCLVIPTEDVRRDPDALVRWLDRHEIGQLFLPNVMLESMCAAVRDRPDRLRALREILQSGEALKLSPAIRDVLRDREDLRILNQYGSAEMQDVTTCTIRKTQVGTRSTAPIGRPLQNTRVYVLDDDLNPVPDGATGELYVAGAGLARGYLRRPGQTAERFLPDPYGPPGERMYRTGDLVRWTEDGELEFAGRADGQVKIRGYRVEVEEVENVLLTRHDVAQAAVAARPGPLDRAQLVAYLVPVQGAVLDPAEIRRSVSHALPAYMVPAAIAVLDGLPLTPSGKVDRAALPAPRFGTTGGRPENERQETLCALFAEVLGLPEVGTDDGFFELGGDSVVAIELVARARRAGLNLTVGDVFERRTVRGLDAVTAAAAKTPRPAAGGPLVVLNEETLERMQAAVPDLEYVLPVTALQQGLMFHALSDGPDDAYVEQMVLHVRGRLDGRALRSAAQRLLDRHAGLRAGFWTEGVRRPVAVVPEHVEVAWAEDQFSDQADLPDLAGEELRRGFDLRRPPLLRFRLVRIGEHEHRLILTFHHVLLDGWSTAILVRDLLALYRSPEDPGLPALPPVQDHARWLAAQDREEAASAWCEALDGLDSPTVLGPARTGTAMPEHLRAELDESVTGDLARLARRHDLTMNTVVQGAWGVLLGALTGRRDVAFGTTVSGRSPEVAGSMDLVGLFINTVPVRMRFDDGEPLTAVLTRAQEQHARMLPHQHLGLGEIQRHAGWERSFDTLVVYENAALRPEASAGPLDGVKPAHIDVTDRTHYPLSLLVVPGARLTIDFAYRPDVLDRERTAAIAARFLRLLTALASGADRTVGEATA